MTTMSTDGATAKVDMSREAVDRRLRELDQLYELGMSLQKAKKIRKVASSPPRASQIQATSMSTISSRAEMSISIDRDRIADFCRRWKVTELALFGSILRDDFRPESDVDVLVTFEPEAPWTLWDLSEMRQELERIFGRAVDLVEKKGLRNPFRRRAVLSSQRLIYAA
jgi:hypothetical protein